MGVYKVDTDDFNEAIARIVHAFKKTNPTLDSVDAAFEDGSSLKLRIKRPKARKV